MKLQKDSSTNVPYIAWGGCDKVENHQIQKWESGQISKHCVFKYLKALTREKTYEMRIKIKCNVWCELALWVSPYGITTFAILAKSEAKTTSKPSYFGVKKSRGCNKPMKNAPQNGRIRWVFGPSACVITCSSLAAVHLLSVGAFCRVFGAPRVEFLRFVVAP